MVSDAWNIGVSCRLLPRASNAVVFRGRAPGLKPGRWVVLAVPPLLMGACARHREPLLVPQDTAMVWPLPPERPRIRLLGEIRGGDDLKPGKSGWQVLRERLHPREFAPTSLSKPHAIAIGDDDRVYVADQGSASLHVMDLNRRTHRVVTDAGSGPLRSPSGVTVAGPSVFVSDAVLGDVMEYSLAGDFVRRLGVKLVRPDGIVYCPKNDRLYVVDTGDHRVAVLGRSDENEGGWSEVDSFGSRGTGEGMFNFPTDITYHPLLGIVVSDTLNFRVQWFTLDGTFVRSIGQKGNGAGDFSLPKGVAVDRYGHLYVVDAQFENVQIFREDGRLLLPFGQEGSDLGAFSLPSGIAIDGHDRIWVADSYNRRLQVFQYLGEPE